MFIQKMDRTPVFSRMENILKRQRDGAFGDILTTRRRSFKPSVGVQRQRHLPVHARNQTTRPESTFQPRIRPTHPEQPLRPLQTLQHFPNTFYSTRPRPGSGNVPMTSGFKNQCICCMDLRGLGIHERKTSLRSFTNNLHPAALNRPDTRSAGRHTNQRSGKINGKQVIPPLKTNDCFPWVGLRGSGEETAAVSGAERG